MQLPDDAREHAGEILHTLAWSYRRGVELLFADGASCEADVGVGNRFEEDFGHHEGIMHRKRSSAVATPARQISDAHRVATERQVGIMRRCGAGFRLFPQEERC